MSDILTTRQRLLNSAGQLFADHGFEGISTRTISEHAGVKLSAIHYHFRTKENLYIETCLAAHASGKSTTFADVINENPNLVHSPEGQAEIIRATVTRSFHDYFRPERPEWESKLILREIATPTTAMPVLVNEMFRPNAESAVSFYLTVNPEATADEAACWSDLLYGQILLYSMARNTLAMVRGNHTLGEAYYRTAARTLSRAMVLEAGLPLPADLQGLHSTSR